MCPPREPRGRPGPILPCSRPQQLAVPCLLSLARLAQSGCRRCQAAGFLVQLCHGWCACWQRRAPCAVRVSTLRGCRALGATIMNVLVFDRPASKPRSRPQAHTVMSADAQHYAHIPAAPTSTNNHSAVQEPLARLQGVVHKLRYTQTETLCTVDLTKPRGHKRPMHIDVS